MKPEDLYRIQETITLLDDILETISGEPRFGQLHRSKIASNIKKTTEILKEHSNVGLALISRNCELESKRASY